MLIPAPPQGRSGVEAEVDTIFIKAYLKDLGLRGCRVALILFV